MLQTLRQVASRVLPPSLVVRRGPVGAKRVALTFDDGPLPLTDAYLRCLDDLGVAATFFLMGDLVEVDPGIVREYVRRGHQVAPHGYHHTMFSSMSSRELAGELRRCGEIFGTQAQARPWVRPPHGALNTRSLAVALASGWSIAMWSFDSYDYKLNSADDLVERCSPTAITDGEIVLMHEGQQWTLDALPRIVEGLRGAGLECVTMADLLAR
ncbi:MAG: polysaccharide deacetylase family protein [Myxococcales bacterium]|nr:polysaccharide deacetylase family protein [Myxococcales bacterium]